MTSKLRKPNENEADDCARLIYISGPDIYSYSFVEKEPRIYEYFKLLYHKPGTMYAKENIMVEAENGKIKGLILAYPAMEMEKLAKKMLRYTRKMFLISGFGNFIKMLFRMGLNKHLPVNANDGYYISNLAVFEEYRGQGIGVKLLEKAEEMAKEKGLDKLSLVVETDNPYAIRVYEKFGFQEVEKVDLPEKYNEYNLIGFLKMVKELG